MTDLEDPQEGQGIFVRYLNKHTSGSFAWDIFMYRSRIIHAYPARQAKKIRMYNLLLDN
jgi:hypothetical protein